jgi:hypothetical protein
LALQIGKVNQGIDGNGGQTHARLDAVGEVFRSKDAKLPVRDVDIEGSDVVHKVLKPNILLALVNNPAFLQWTVKVFDRFHFTNTGFRVIGQFPELFVSNSVKVFIFVPGMLILLWLGNNVSAAVNHCAAWDQLSCSGMLTAHGDV